ncbi:MAG: hypothetical protein HIU57_05010 [Acidobacteria bacterium]|nr:hypothetical protein [Acidobacteriota bacterium]
MLMRIVAGLSLVAGSLLLAVPSGAVTPSAQVTWASPMDLALGATYNSTVRDVATVAVSGSSIALTFSNLWSATPTTFGAVTVGIEQSGPTVVPGTFVPVTFANGSRAVTIPAYGRVTSDPVPLAVHAHEQLSVSIVVMGWATVSVHFCCIGRINSWATSDGVGDHTTDPTGQSFNPSLTDGYIRWLSGITVVDSPARGSIVAFGDSITDGYGYENAGFSWVDALQQRIDQLPPSQRMSVVNEGIAGNTLTVFPPRTSFDKSSGGLPGVTRLATDALAWPGVKDVVVLLGTNDIWFGAGGVAGGPIPPYGTAASIEAGLRSIAAQTRARGMNAYAITLLPRATSTNKDHDLPEYWGPAEQSVMTAVNSWLLSGTSGFTGVINLAAVMGDVYNGDCLPNTPFEPYFNPDHLHPNVAGETVMANAISTQLFGLSSAPLNTTTVPAVPTPGCAPAGVAAALLATAAPTTTVPSTTTIATTTTTTTIPPASSRITPHSALFAVLAGLVVLALILSIVVRRRVVRRRRRRRVALRGTTPPRRVPPGGSVSPRPKPPRR